MSKISLSSEFCLGAPSVQNSPGCKSLWIQNRHEAEAAIAPFQPPSYRGKTLRNDNPHTAAASQNCHRKKKKKWKATLKKKCVCVYDFYFWILVHCNRKILWNKQLILNEAHLKKRHFNGKHGIIPCVLLKIKYGTCTAICGLLGRVPLSWRNF